MHELHRIEPILSKVNSAETVIQNISYICGKTNICQKSTLTIWEKNFGCHTWADTLDSKNLLFNLQHNSCVDFSAFENISVVL